MKNFLFLAMLASVLPAAAADLQTATSAVNQLGLDLLPRKRQRALRASWWFERMRAVVDCAFNWSAAPQPRPEQFWLPDTRREMRV